MGGYSSSASYFGTTSFWTMTPRRYNSFACMYIYNRDGNNQASTWLTNRSYAFRPVVSIKPGMRIEVGDGTSTNPYVLQTT